MAQTFDEVANKAGTGMVSAVRALQAWQYLIGKACRRQTVKYEKVRDLLGYPPETPPSRVHNALGCIMHFCRQSNLPPLTIIVVNKEGVPGEGMPVSPVKTVDQLREDVFGYPWHSVFPPTVEEFVAARQLGA